MTIKQAIEVLKIEADGILKLTEKIDDNFTKMVDLIYKSRGRVIFAGIGKSGIIGRKIAATLSSTGTRSIFLHPVEAMHGDLGIVSHQDVFIALSNSGETDELNILLPSIRNAGCPIIAFTGNKNSTLARHSDIVIDVGIEVEACPLGLAPTTSTTALLAMGDALAVVLINKHKFSPTDFKKFHPGGNLGQRLSSFKVKDIMLTGHTIPVVNEHTDMANALDILDKQKLGVVLIRKTDDTLSGIITDGDVRRMLVRKIDVFEKTVDELMIENPKSIHENAPLYDALNIMETHQITVLPVIDMEKKIAGVLHLHDILGKGAVKFNGI
ncbi:MAG: KpsF/GutQ family sugar-phosphate isomerase [Desulfobacteraceae bacterium]|nr:KpsF/GutQ family sugar-phosphate isomerase [Desulfobacteraceae bacterium]MBC2754891.1 KpsF/GutQ family sugar-phosphate isomerase [Desulfobacteraceae bacterium]